VTDELLTIGALARLSGLTASALRFYGDCGLLLPARVDPVTGYRYYHPTQTAQATLVRQLREIGVPLGTVEAILSGDPAQSATLLDDYVLDLRTRAEAAAILAESVKAALGTQMVRLPTEHLAAAIGQVWPAAARAELAVIPALAGVLLEASPGALTLTATDRYRLSTRTLSVTHPGPTFTILVPAKSLANLTPALSGSHEAALSATGTALTIGVNGKALTCPAIPDLFPDYRGMLTRLTPPQTRIVQSRESLLALCETAAPTVTVAGVHFDRTALHRAVTTAIGPEILLDLSGPARPAVLRSATDGDLTTLIMPREAVQ
jgi:DNA polymerase-3 subunit beta